MSLLQNKGRVAGLWYLGVIVFGIGAEVIRVQTSTNIAGSEFLFRLGIVSDLAMMVSFLFLGLTFYRLLGPTDERVAQVLLAFVGLSVAVMLANLGNQAGALVWLTNPELAVFGHEVVQNQALASMKLYRSTYQIANLFNALWLLPLGILFLRSRRVPRWLGYLVIVDSLAFLLDVLTGFLVPTMAKTISLVTVVPLTLGEFSICFWLLIRGTAAVQGDSK